ncbi:MAG: hypothetical protein IIC01_13725, partial [Planctomycetes bacterium]|nr:hypothetical protein [Planctomycetota bacterium]
MIWGGNSPQHAQRSSVGLWLTHVTVALFTGAAVTLLTGAGHAAEPSAGPVVEGTGFEQSDGWCPGFVCGPEFFNCFEPLNDPTTNCGSDNPNPATGKVVPALQGIATYTGTVTFAGVDNG